MKWFMWLFWCVAMFAEYYRGGDWKFCAIMMMFLGVLIEMDPKVSA